MQQSEISVPIGRIARHEMLLETIKFNEAYCLELATELNKGYTIALNRTLIEAIEVMEKNTNIYLNY